MLHHRNLKFGPYIVFYSLKIENFTVPFLRAIAVVKAHVVAWRRVASSACQFRPLRISPTMVDLCRISFSLAILNPIYTYNDGTLTIIYNLRGHRSGFPDSSILTSQLC